MHCTFPFLFWINDIRPLLCCLPTVFVDPPPPCFKSLFKRLHGDRQTDYWLQMAFIGRKLYTCAQESTIRRKQRVKSQLPFISGSQCPPCQFLGSTTCIVCIALGILFCFCLIPLGFFFYKLNIVSYITFTLRDTLKELLTWLFVNEPE